MQADLGNRVTGAAKDKVIALERAGAIVSDSPAKLGSLLLAVRPLSFIPICYPSAYDLNPLQEMQRLGLH